MPEDVSIVAFNNSLFAKLASPQLTSVEVNSFQLGYEAVSQAFNHTENPNLMAAKIIVPHRLVVRSSCKALEDDSAKKINPCTEECRRVLLEPADP